MDDSKSKQKYKHAHAHVCLRALLHFIVFMHVHTYAHAYICCRKLLWRLFKLMWHCTARLPHPRKTVRLLTWLQLPGAAHKSTAWCTPACKVRH